jgi:alkylation response protein AidB-like acyl-CoA dehydrogenase
MQQRVAESGAEVAAARRLLEGMCDRFDEAIAADQGPMSAGDRVQFRWDAAYVVELSRRAIERLFAASGAHGIYEGNPVYRAYRDINTACHHAVIDFDTVWGCAGRLLCRAILARILAPCLSLKNYRAVHPGWNLAW